MFKAVPEIVPEHRWPHQQGQQLSITYRWASSLTNPNHTWRIAFVYGIASWDNVDSLVHLYYHSGSQNVIDMVDDPLRKVAFTNSADTNGDGYTDWVIVYGNIYYDLVHGYSPNQRQSLAAHEIGHLIRLGHIPRTELPSLMWEQMSWEEMENIYYPQFNDIQLIFQVYP